ncbi:unnamed protein product [Cunninghamella blakesleeana]
MNHLPNEICILIFQQLTQRNVFYCSTVCKRWYKLICQPTFYQTINIYSYQQWIQFLHTSETFHLYQDKPLKHYVYHFCFHIDVRLFLSFIISNMKLYSNLQSIHIIKKSNHHSIQQQQIQKSFHKYNKSILLNQLTHIPIWYKQQFNNTNHKNRRIISLDYDVLSSPPSSLKNNIDSIIYLNSIGPEKSINDHPYYSYLNKMLWMNRRHHHQQLHLHHHDILSRYQNKTLIFSKVFTYHNLVKLSIHFQGSLAPSSTNIIDSLNLYDLDERIFESIHQQCPQLEKLCLFHFYMNISEDYINDNKKMMIMAPSPCSSLKKLYINGILIHPSCFRYLSQKYPRLISFQFILHWNPLYINFNSTYSMALYQMIIQYLLLKELSITIINENDKKEGLSTFELLDWLNDHPQQLSHLSYYNTLLPLTSTSSTTSSTTTIINNNKNNLNIMKQPKIGKGSFLNYLVYLALDYYDFIDTVINYLLIHPNSCIVSSSIKNIKIYTHPFQKKKKKDHPISYLYINDWLDMFPNAHTLTLNNINYLIDYLPIENNDNSLSSSSSSLYKLIKQRKKEQEQPSFKKTTSFYKLKKLEVYNSAIQFKHGWNSFFKKFNRLNEIILDTIYYHCFKKENIPTLNKSPSPSILLPLDQAVSELDLDLPFTLDRFSMIDFYVISPSTFFSFLKYDQSGTKSSLINTIKVKESLSQKNYTIHAQDSFTGRQLYTYFHYCTLNLSCQYVDEFSFFNSF